MPQPKDLETNTSIPPILDVGETQQENKLAARDETVLWPKAFHPVPHETVPRHPRFIAKPRKIEHEMEIDPYAHMMICPVCDSVADSIKCKLVCPNCHTIVQSCCD